MANGRPGQPGETASSRPVNLEGDSPELVAFALLRYLAQLEQGRANETGIVFDRDWLLDAYSDCLKAVKGQRASSAPAPSASKPAAGRTAKR